MTARVRGVIAASIAAGRDAERVRLDVDEDRGRAGQRDGVGRGGEGEGRDDDLVAGADAQRDQGQVQRGGAGVDGNALRARRRSSANSCSKAATCGPCASHPEARTASTAARSSSPISGLAARDHPLTSALLELVVGHLLDVLGARARADPEVPVVLDAPAGRRRGRPSRTGGPEPRRRGRSRGRRARRSPRRPPSPSDRSSTGATQTARAPIEAPSRR